MERALSHEEFMAKVNRDYAEGKRLKKKTHVFCEADAYIRTNAARIKRSLRGEKKGSVNCGRC